MHITFGVSSTNKPPEERCEVTEGDEVQFTPKDGGEELEKCTLEIMIGSKTVKKFTPDDPKSANGTWNWDTTGLQPGIYKAKLVVPDGEKEKEAKASKLLAPVVKA